jgi:peptidoglycan/xylan/chitin deacetylase (PgdA/CDA1 family)
MMPLKTQFFKFITPFEKVISMQQLLKWSKHKLILPLYHSVNDTIPPHLLYLYEVHNKNEFVRDLDILLKQFHPIDLSELIDIIQNNKPINKPCFHLTFDDGLSSFFNTVAPILKQKGIPATNFLNSAFIGNRELFFRHKVSLIIDKLHHQKGNTQLWENYHRWSKQNQLSKEYYQKLLLSIQYDERHILDELAPLLEMDFLKYLQENKPYLEKQQITSLISQGFTFGAHSIDHPEFRFIAGKDQLRQTTDSVNAISTEFNLPYRVFSFPFTDYGISRSFFETIYNDKTVELTFGTAGIKDDSVKNNLQRIPAELKNLSLKEILKKEYLYYCLLKSIGKHQIKRG